MPHAVKIENKHKGEEKMKKRNVVKLISLGVLAAALTGRQQCTGRGRKSGYSNDIH